MPLRPPLAALAIAGCPLFPADNHWNQPVDRLPVHARSDAMMRSIGLDRPVHPDFGSGRYEGRRIGIPYRVVPRGLRRVRVRFEHAAESDRGPYPIPRDPPIEGGSDRHMLLVERGTCRLYELFDARRGRRGWLAGSGAIFDLRSNRLRPRGWTSADAAGLPILPGLVRYDEVRRGAIRHALRFTVQRTRRAFVYPARHFASPHSSLDLPAMGQRLRLKRRVDPSAFPRQSRVIVRALKRYGMLLADNGSSIYVTGAPSPGWDNDDLRSLGQLTGSDFEVVDTRAIGRPRGG
ncbi:MAG TPA: hypothetical protein VGW75_06345 [Solirubrobacteraceae bacterium]|jgi:hypothetical protein|nr:hypothetical protein [Solirubrobacteraceae bacterium]